MKLLRDVLPTGESYSFSEKKLNTTVIKTHDLFEGGKPWPGKHKCVCVWWELSDGTAVAWNENLSRGWSFPIRRL